MHHDMMYKGMLYIGTRPTMDGKIRSIEVNIFEFSQTIYGDTLTVYFIELIRNDQKFADMTELQQQLRQDYSKTIDLFSRLAPEA
jgi:riboflavin kinase/FMN adenylyltransferase